MQNLHRNILITIVAVIVIFSFSLSIFLYTQNKRIAAVLLEQKKTFEVLQKEKSSLEEENSSIGRQLKDKNTLLEQASQEKDGLEKKISAVKEELSVIKTENSRLEENLKDEESALLLLRKENEKLKSDSVAKEAQINKSDSKDNMQKIDKETETIIQKTGLDKIKPKDFVTDFKGSEQFLQNCSTQVCMKIILNNSGIEYARSAQWEKAELVFKEVLAIDPGYNPVKLNLGLVYDKTKSKKDAVYYWLKVYDIKA